MRLPACLSVLPWSALLLVGACQKEPPPPPPKPAEAPNPPPKPAVDAKALQERAKAMFGSIAPMVTDKDPAVEAARVDLGKALYFEARISAGKDISCNTCHDLANFGVDAREKDGQRLATSMGHKGQLGDRNSPTTLNAFAHFTQFWDGRAKDVEEQAKGPVLNPVEMAMKSDAEVMKVLKAIPGYKAKFAAAFPGEKDPMTWDNYAKAVGAFERKLVTPAKFDDFLTGKLDALDEKQLQGLELFAERCVACHMGPALGGSLYQKLGLMKPYATKDEGRFKVTKNEADKHLFKVPSLRNIEKTGPYLHDGSIKTLPEVVALMGEVQTAQGKLTDDQVAKIVAFLGALTGTPPADLVAPPPPVN